MDIKISIEPTDKNKYLVTTEWDNGNFKDEIANIRDLAEYVLDALSKVAYLRWKIDMDGWVIISDCYTLINFKEILRWTSCNWSKPNEVLKEVAKWFVYLYYLYYAERQREFMYYKDIFDTTVEFKVAGHDYDIFQRG